MRERRQYYLAAAAGAAAAGTGGGGDRLCGDIDWDGTHQGAIQAPKDYTKLYNTIQRQEILHRYLKY